jgi:hypothetical protein
VVGKGEDGGERDFDAEDGSKANRGTRDADGGETKARSSRETKKNALPEKKMCKNAPSHTNSFRWLSMRAKYSLASLEDDVPRPL